MPKPKKPTPRPDVETLGALVQHVQREGSFPVCWSFKRNAEAHPMGQAIRYARSTGLIAPSTQDPRELAPAIAAALALHWPHGIDGIDPIAVGVAVLRAAHPEALETHP